MKTKIIAALLLAAVSMLVLMAGSETLVLAELRNPLASTPGTFALMMEQPMGLLAWLGCWLTQCCQSPALGASVLTAIWVASFWLISRRFASDADSSTLAAVPALGLLCSIVQLGYWMYCTRLGGYIYSHSLAVLIISICLNIKPLHIAAGIIVPLLAYPIMGFWGVVLALAIFTANLHYGRLAAVVAMASGVAAPLLWYFTCYSNYMPIGQIFTIGLPHFAHNGTSAPQLLIPLVAVAIWLVGISFFYPLMQKLKFAGKALVVLALAACIYTMGHGDSFGKEILMTKAALSSNWQQVRDIASASKKHTETMRLFNELAMIQTGSIDNKAFESLHDDYANPEAQNIKVNTQLIAANVIHYCYGRYNTAIHWSMTIGVKYGFGIVSCKILALAHMANGEMAAAQKYTSIISRTLCHKDWRPSQPTDVTKNLHYNTCDIQESELGCESFIKYYLTMAENINTQPQLEMAMYHAMKDRNITEFRKAITLDSLITKPLGRNFQEACCIFCDSVGAYVEPKTKADFAEFNMMLAKLNATQDKAIIKPIHQQFGESYWWYMYFEK